MYKLIYDNSSYVRINQIQHSIMLESINNMNLLKMTDNQALRDFVYNLNKGLPRAMSCSLYLKKRIGFT